MKKQRTKSQEDNKMNKYSLANIKRWANPEYKNRVGKKISAALKGKFLGEKHPLYGKHHTEETKKKIRRSDYHKNLKGTMIGNKN